MTKSGSLDVTPGRRFLGYVTLHFQYRIIPVSLRC